MFAFLSILLCLSLLRFGANEPQAWLAVALVFAAGLVSRQLVRLSGVGTDTRQEIAFLGLATVAAGLAIFVDVKLALGPMAGICAWMAARQRPDSVHRFFHVLLAIGIFEALLGLFQHFVAPGWILGYANATLATSGTLINRNHFAGLMGMLIPVALGLAYTSWVRHRDPGRTYLYLLAGSVMGLALAFSLSRMGIVSFLLTLGMLSILVRWTHSRRFGSVFALVPLFLVLSGAAWIGTDVIVERFGQLLGPDGMVQDARPAVYRDTLRMIAENPFGIGVGAYEDRFRRYQTVSNHLLFDHAHNDYLETAAEWGIPIALLFWLGIFWVLGRAVGAFVRTRNPVRRGTLLVSIGAIFSILVHSLVDFNLQIPSNAMLFAAFVGIAIATTKGAERVSAVGRANTTAKSPPGTGGGARSDEVVGWDLTLGSLLRPGIAGVLCVLVFSAVWGPFMGATLTRGDPPAPEAWERALEYDPENADYHFVLGQIRSSARYRNDEAALEHYLEATRLNPDRTAHWLALSAFYEQTGASDEASLAMDRALELDPNDAATHWATANFYVRLGDPARADAMLTRTAALDPAYVQPVLDLAWNLYGDASRIMSTHVPDTREANLIALRYFVAQSDASGATLAWERLRRFETRAEDRLPYVNFLIAQGQSREAYAVFLPSTSPSEIPPAFFNGSFETEPMNGGFDWQYVTGPAEVRRDTTQSREGMASLMIEFAGEENVSYSHVSHALAVEQGQAYELTFWMRTEAISTDQGVYVEVDGQRSEAVLGTTFWQEFTIGFEASAELVRVRVRRDSSQRFDNLLSGTVWFDAFELTPLRTEAANGPTKALPHAVGG